MIGREREVVVVVGVPIRLVVHLYKEQRIIIDLFMDRQNRWRPIEMRQAGRLYISAQILANVEGFNKNKWRANSSSSSERATAVAAPLSFCLSPAARSVITLKTA